MPLLIIDYEGWLLERQDDDFRQRTCPYLPPTNLQHNEDRFMAGAGKHFGATHEHDNIYNLQQDACAVLMHP